MAPTIEQIVADFDADAPLERAATIPGAWYTDPRVAELERRTVWSRTWQMVARRAQVAEPGQYATATVAGEPILVVRGEDGVLRAFFNVCRHHAAAVMTEACGRAERLRCPYHGWTYALDGSLRGVPEFQGVQGFDRASNGLVPVAVAEWEQFVFVHLDADAPPLASHLGGLVERFRPMQLERLRFCERREYEIACNWKVFVDNAIDGGYHIPHLHAGLDSVLSPGEYTVESRERWCLQSSPIVTSGGDGQIAEVRRGQACYWWIYPNLMLNCYAGYLDTNLVVPLGVDCTRVIFEFWFDDVGPARAARNRASMEVSERIQDEDGAMCASVQRGLASRAYGAGRLSVRREGGVNLFHRLLARDLRSGIQ